MMKFCKHFLILLYFVYSIPLFSPPLDGGNGGRGNYISSDFATIFAEKVINSYTKFPKTKSQATHNKQLAYFINIQSFPFLKISQLHLIIYKVQQTHRSDKTVGFVFYLLNNSSEFTIPTYFLNRFLLSNIPTILENAKVLLQMYLLMYIATSSDF